MIDAESFQTFINAPFDTIGREVELVDCKTVSTDLCCQDVTIPRDPREASSQNLFGFGLPIIRGRVDVIDTQVERVIEARLAVVLVDRAERSTE